MESKSGGKKQTKQLILWIIALAIGAILGMLGIGWLNGLMNFIATVYTRLFQLLAVPTIALAVMTTLASLGNQADTGKIFRHALTYTLLTTFDSERAIIAGVIDNRLKENMLLQL